MENLGTEESAKVRGRQRITVEVPLRSLIHALELVDSGRFQGLDELIAAAIEAMYAKQGRAGILVGGQGEPVLPTEPPRRAADLEGADFREPQTVEPLPPASRPHPLLPIIVPRLFPCKLTLRHLSRALGEAGSEYMPAEEARKQLRYKAFSWTASLKQLDIGGGMRIGERLATAFPTANRDQERSMNRFLEAFLGSAYTSSPVVSGALPFLGFVSLVGPAGHEKVGITKAGLEFAKTANPVLDEGETMFPPFRNEEVAQLLAAIDARAPEEMEHMRVYIQAVRDLGRASRAALVAKMRTFYVRFWSPHDLSPGMVESLRATVNSRCQELGLVRTQRSGRTAAYELTDAGARWLVGQYP